MLTDVVTFILKTIRLAEKASHKTVLENFPFYYIYVIRNHLSEATSIELDITEPSIYYCHPNKHVQDIS